MRCFTFGVCRLQHDCTSCVDFSVASEINSLTFHAKHLSFTLLVLEKYSISLCTVVSEASARYLKRSYRCQVGLILCACRQIAASVWMLATTARTVSVNDPEQDAGRGLEVENCERIATLSVCLYMCFCRYPWEPVSTCCCTDMSLKLEFPENLCLDHWSFYCETQTWEIATHHLISTLHSTVLSCLLF